MGGVGQLVYIFFGIPEVLRSCLGLAGLLNFGYTLTEVSFHGRRINNSEQQFEQVMSCIARLAGFFFR